MERILQGGMERGYGTGVWNGCGPGACSGPPILTCTHIYIYYIIYMYVYSPVPGRIYKSEQVCVCVFFKGNAENAVNTVVFESTSKNVANTVVSGTIQVFWRLEHQKHQYLRCCLFSWC